MVNTTYEFSRSSNAQRSASGPSRWKTQAGFVELHVRRPHAETKVGETRAVNDVTLYETGLWLRGSGRHRGGSSAPGRSANQGLGSTPPNPHPRVATSERTALLLLTTVTPALTSIRSVIWPTAQIPSPLPPRPPDEGVLGIQGPGQRRAIVNSNPPVGPPIDPLQSKMGTPAVVERGVLEVTEVVSLQTLNFRLPQHHATYTQAQARCRSHSGFVLSNRGWGLCY